MLSEQSLFVALAERGCFYQHIRVESKSAYSSVRVPVCGVLYLLFVVQFVVTQQASNARLLCVHTHGPPRSSWSSLQRHPPKSISTKVMFSEYFSLFIIGKSFQVKHYYVIINSHRVFRYQENLGRLCCFFIPVVFISMH